MEKSRQIVGNSPVLAIIDTACLYHPIQAWTGHLAPLKVQPEAVQVTLRDDIDPSLIVRVTSRNRLDSSLLYVHPCPGVDLHRARSLESSLI